MKVELRNIQYFAAGTQETPCFKATVYVDGVRAGTAENSGHGGSTLVQPQTLSDQLTAWGDTQPEVVTNYKIRGELFRYKRRAEHIIDDLVTDWLIERDLKQALASKILFTKADGQLYQTGRMTKDRKAAYLADAAWISKAEAVKVLNLLPFAEAKELYRKAAE